MNLQEFAALKVGDKVTNPMNNHCPGEVVEVTDSGVRLVWGPRAERETRFFYSVNGTAWFHWSKGEDSLDAALDDFVQHPPAAIMREPGK